MKITLGVLAAAMLVATVKSAYPDEGQWRYISIVDAMTDEENFYAISPPGTADFPMAGNVFMTARCDKMEEKLLRIYFGIHTDYLNLVGGSDKDALFGQTPNGQLWHRLETRIDKRKSLMVSAYESTAGGTLWITGLQAGVILTNFAQMKLKRFLVRLNYYQRGRVLFTFPLVGMDRALAKLEAKCKYEYDEDFGIRSNITEDEAFSYAEIHCSIFSRIPEFLGRSQSKNPRFRCIEKK